MKFIQTVRAPIPKGHYAQAVVANGFIFVAGQLPIGPAPQRQIVEGIAAQTEQVFLNVKAILQAAGSDLDRLVSVQIFLSNMDLWGAVDEVYRSILGDHKPARAVIPCVTLRGGALLEVCAVAVCPAKSDGQ